MSTEATLRQAVIDATGLTTDALPADVALSRLGVDPDDAEAAFDAACSRLGVDPESINWGTDPASLGPGKWTMTSLRHVAPFWPAAKTEAEADRHIWPDPTIRSLAATIDQRRHVTSGPDVPAPRLAPLSAAQVVVRGASVTLLTLIGLPGIEQIACSPDCRNCFASLPEAAFNALPGTLPILFLVLAAILTPAVVHMWQRRPARHSPSG
jgi:hypothetical protein